MPDLIRIAQFFVDKPEWVVVIIVVAMFLYYGELRERRGESRDKEMLTVIRENSTAFGRIEKALERWSTED